MVNACSGKSFDLLNVTHQIFQIFKNQTVTG